MLRFYFYRTDLRPEVVLRFWIFFFFFIISVLSTFKRNKENTANHKVFRYFNVSDNGRGGKSLLRHDIIVLRFIIFRLLRAKTIIILFVLIRFNVIISRLGNERIGSDNNNSIKFRRYSSALNDKKKDIIFIRLFYLYRH